MTSYVPSVDTTIFPRVNFYKNFTGRAVRRDMNGRIYGRFGAISIDSDFYPPSDGSTCLRILLPHDLGPLVTTPTTKLYDLREDCGEPRVIDLQLLGPKEGSTCLRVEYPYDLGPSVTSATTELFDLRNDCDRPSTIDLGIAGPEEISTVLGDLTFSVNDIEPQVGQALTLLINDPVPASVVFSGDAENPTYLWTARANYPLMVGQQAANTVLTFPTEGMVTVQCKVSDGNSIDSPQVASVDVFVVDA